MDKIHHWSSFAVHCQGLKWTKLTISRASLFAVRNLKEKIAGRCEGRTRREVGQSYTVTRQRLPTATFEQKHKQRTRTSQTLHTWPKRFTSKYVIAADLFVDGSDEHSLDLHASHLGGPETEVEEDWFDHLYDEHQHRKHVSLPSRARILGRGIVYEQPRTYVSRA